jgi:hypothetical protein
MTGFTMVGHIKWGNQALASQETTNRAKWSPARGGISVRVPIIMSTFTLKNLAAEIVLVINILNAVIFIRVRVK